MTLGRVRRVRLYLDRAAITRSVVVDADAIDAGIVLEPLPLDLDTTTVRASAHHHTNSGEAPVRVTSVLTSPLFERVEDDRRERLAEQMHEIDAKLASMTDAEATEERAATLLSAYARHAMKQLSAEWLTETPDFESWGACFDHIREARARLFAAKSKRHDDRRALQEKRADLLAEERRIEHPVRRGYRVTVRVALPKSATGRVQVDVTYLTHRAKWSPGYDARHWPATKDRPEHVALTGLALVEQHTGEDWEDVEVVVTTGAPPIAAEAPELSAIVLRGGHDDPGGADGLFDAGSSTEAVEYRAAAKVSVPSALQPVRVALFSDTLLASARREVAPRRHPVAAIVLEATNDSGRVLFPGRVNVFRGTQYAGQSIIERVPKGERLRLPLGVDRTIRVRREATSVAHKSALIGTVSHTFEILTHFENLSAAPVELVVRERVPVSRSEDMTVKLLTAERAQEVDPDTGLSKLVVKLDAYGRRHVGTSYRVTAPRGFELNDPNQRSR